MKTLVLILTLAACGSSDPMPDAMAADPTGMWNVSLSIDADNCGHAATSEVEAFTVICNTTTSPVSGCSIAPATAKSILGAMVSCTTNACQASFTLDWTAGSTNYVESYNRALFIGTFLNGSGTKSFNQGSTSCAAQFGFTGSRS